VKRVAGLTTEGTVARARFIGASATPPPRPQSCAPATTGRRGPTMHAGQLARAAGDVLLHLLPFEELPCGLAVCLEGSAGRWARLPSSSDDVTPARLLGVALWTRGTVAHPRGRAAPIVRRGRLWVLSEEDTHDGAPVYVRHAPSGGLLQLGALRASPDPTDPNDPTTATAALLEHAAWRSEVARGGAWVELNPP